MGKASSPPPHPSKQETEQQHCLPLILHIRRRNSKSSINLYSKNPLSHLVIWVSKSLQNPFSHFVIWVSKSLQDLSFKAHSSNELLVVVLRRFLCLGLMVRGSVLSDFITQEQEEEGKEQVGMGSLVEKEEESEEMKSGLSESIEQVVVEEEEEEECCRKSVSSCCCCDTSTSEESMTSYEDPNQTTTTSNSSCSSSSSNTSSCSEGCTSPAPARVRKPEVVQKDSSSLTSSTSSSVAGDEEKPKLENQDSKILEIEMMKERFSKLLLGEDMSGCGKGVSTALAISNAITNLCATLFGQLWRLEPITQEKKSMWRREMEWLLCVSDHIVELIPSWQTFPDGSKLEVMTCRPRSDLYINLPALRKLDNMLLEILDSFSDTEFWYVDQGIVAPEADGSASFRRPLQRQEEKWWLPVPRVPVGGLQDDSRKQLQHKRDCTNQILKAVMAINSIALAEMEVPESYLEALPKNGRASLGDVIHRYITSDQFSPECLLDCIDLSSEHQALEIANRVEASIYVWRRRTNTKTGSNRSTPKSSWEMVKDFMGDAADKRELLADRAESLLLCLKQRFPGLSQTQLDMSKIQFNKDVGKSILESYSRVLESLAFNIVARIDDLLYADDLSKNSDQLSSVPTVTVIAHKRVSIPHSSVPVSNTPYSSSMPVSSTPYTSAYTTPNFSPAHLVSSPAKGRVLNCNKPPHPRGFGVKKVLTDYLGGESKSRNSTGSPLNVLESIQTSISTPKS